MSTQILNLLAKVDTKEVKEAGKDFEGLKDKLKDLTKEVPGLGSAMNGAGSRVGEMREMLHGLGSSLTALPSAIVGVAGAMAALGIAMAFKYNEVLDGFGDMGAKFGITADQAYYLSTAAKQAGGDLEALMMMGQKLSKAMSNSGEEMKGVGAAFKRLGVETQDASGRLKSNEEVANELMKKWEESKKTASDYSDMQQILGKNFEQQLPVLKNVMEAHEAQLKMYEKGIGITKDSLDVTDKSEKSQLQLGAAFNSMGSILVSIVVPAFTSITNWFVRSYTEGGVVAKTFTAIALATELVVGGFKIMTAGVLTLVEGFSMGIDVVKTFGSVMYKVLTGDFEGAQKSLTSGMDDIAKRSKGLKNDLEGLSLHYEGSNLQKVMNGESIINKNKKELEAPRANPIFSAAAGGNVRPDTGTNAQKEQDPLEKLIQTLKKELDVRSELNKETQVTNELKNKQFANYTAEQKAQAILIGHQIDLASANKMVEASTKSLNKTADDYVTNLQDEVRLKNMSARDYKAYIEVRKLEIETQKTINDLKAKGLWNADAETKEMEALAIAKKKVADATAEAKKRDDDWLGNGVDRYVKSLGTMNEAATNLTEKGLKGIEEGITGLLTGAGFSFKNFAKMIVDELVKMAVQFLIMGPIIQQFKIMMATVSFFGQGGVSTGGFTAMHANGAVASSNKSGYFGGVPATMGESGDEAILPLKKNAAGDLGVVAHASAGGGGNNTQINNITINGDSSSDPNVQAQQARMISQMLDRKWDERFATASRPGGIANRVSMTI